MHMKCSLQILHFNKEIWPSSSVSTVKSSLKDHLLNVFKLTESYFFVLASEAILIAQRKEHVGHQYHAMHFENNTRWRPGRETLNNVFASYISRVNQRIALLLENQSGKNSYQLNFD